MKNIQEIITRLEGLEALCWKKKMAMDTECAWEYFHEALGVAVSALRGKHLFQEEDWVPIENRLPDDNTDVLVTVQEMIPNGDVYRSIDCIINEGDGPFWAEHHGAWDRVLAWAPMLPVYVPDESRKKDV